MKKLRQVLLFVFVLLCSQFIFAPQAHAQDVQDGRPCTIVINSGVPASPNSAGSPSLYPVREGGKLVNHVTITSTLGFSDIPDTEEILLWHHVPAALSGWESFVVRKQPDGSLQGTWNYNPVNPVTRIQFVPYYLNVKRGGTPICQTYYAHISRIALEDQKNWLEAEKQLCDSLKISPATGLVEGSPVTADLFMPDNLLTGSDLFGDQVGYSVELYRKTALVYRGTITSRGPLHIQIPAGSVGGGFVVGDYSIKVKSIRARVATLVGPTDAGCGTQSFCLGTSTIPGEVGKTCSGRQVVDGEIKKLDAFKLCEQVADPALRQKCQDCAAGAVNGSAPEDGAKSVKGIWTGIGCIPTEKSSLVQTLVRAGLAISGGVALLMFLAAAFLLTTSQGEQKRATEAKELMTSAVFGLLFIIFSVTILRIIGVQILQIPGFGG